MPSLGTIVGSNVILTHNHYGASMGTLPNEALAFTEANGEQQQVRYADVNVLRIDGGTTLLTLPGNLTPDAAPVADHTIVEGLAVGSWLSVAYWDDANNQFAQAEFQIVKINDGVATLADPDRIIHGGDSGGGAFFEGKLVGNTWSINTDQNLDPLGTFNVALLPSQAVASIP